MGLSSALFFLGAPLLNGCQEAPEVAKTPLEPIVIEASPLGLDDLKLDSAIVGDLKYRGGLRLTSLDPRFGGLSYLDVSADRRTFVALSDGGYRLRGELAYDASGHLSGITGTFIETLQGLDDQFFDDEECECDAVSRAPNGELVIALDRGRRLLVYPEGKGPPRPMIAPKGLAKTDGIRAIALMPDNRFFALAEVVDDAYGLPGWIGNNDGWARVNYTTCAQSIQDMRHRVEAAACLPRPSGPPRGDIEEFRVAGATTMPGGDILVVESGFPYVATRLRRVKAENIKPGANLAAEELAVLEGALPFHNVQGISAGQTGTGKTVIYLVSDDNYTGPQPTALMMFELLRADSESPATTSSTG
jgi:hypothetical protein